MRFFNFVANLSSGIFCLIKLCFFKNTNQFTNKKRQPAVASWRLVRFAVTGLFGTLFGGRCCGREVSLLHKRFGSLFDFLLQHTAVSLNLAARDESRSQNAENQQGASERPSSLLKKIGGLADTHYLIGAAEVRGQAAALRVLYQNNEYH